MGFWAWTIIGPLSARYTQTLDLNPSQASILVAMPILVGSLARIPVGAWTDRYGGRRMFTLVLGVTAPLVLLTAARRVNRTATPCSSSSRSSSASPGRSSRSAFRSVPPGTTAAGKGFATGVFGAGMVGTAVSAFFTPRLVTGVGYFNAHLIIAGVVALMAVISWLVLRESPAWSRPTDPTLPKIRHAFTLRATWQLCFLYGIVFGAFVAFSNYLPTYLGNVYNWDATDAGTRTAGFAVAAVIARPIGGTIADRIGPKIVTLVSFAGHRGPGHGGGVPAQPGTGLRNGVPAYGRCSWGWARAACSPGWDGSLRRRTWVRSAGSSPPPGGLGGYFPPLVMGATYDAENSSYFVGLTLLAVFAALALLLTFTVRNGGKTDERAAAPSS